MESNIKRRWVPLKKILSGWLDWAILGNIDNKRRKDKLGESDTRETFRRYRKIKEISTPNSKFPRWWHRKLPLKRPLFNSWAVWSNIEPYGYSCPSR